MAIGLRNAGEAPLDLDWEGHEDLTLQTASFGSDQQPQKGPATRGSEEAGPLVVVDEGPKKEAPAAGDEDPALGFDEKTPTGLTAVDEPGSSPWILVALIAVLAAVAWFLFGR
jgi:hypothetical protein